MFHTHSTRARVCGSVCWLQSEGVEVDLSAVNVDSANGAGERDVIRFCISFESQSCRSAQALSTDSGTSSSSFVYRHLTRHAPPRAHTLTLTHAHWMSSGVPIIVGVSGSAKHTLLCSHVGTFYEWYVNSRCYTLWSQHS